MPWRSCYIWSMKIGGPMLHPLHIFTLFPLPCPPGRKGAGLPLFGKSFTYPAKYPNSRVDFQFDNAAFHFRALPFTIPYPVPFRLLGDETKGWLDITYMSQDGNFRLSRGNKGTLFILVSRKGRQEGRGWCLCVDTFLGQSAVIP